MSDQPPFRSQTSGSPGSVYSGSIYPPQMPNYQPQQQAYASTQSTQPPFAHQTSNSSASGYSPSPPHPSAHSPPSRPVSRPPPFPTPLIHGVHGGYPPTNPGLPQAYTPPRQDPQVAGGWEHRDNRNESNEISPQVTRNRGSDERERAPPRPPSAGRTAGVEPNGCCCTVV